MFGAYSLTVPGIAIAIRGCLLCTFRRKMAAGIMAGGVSTELEVIYIFKLLACIIWRWTCTDVM